MVRWLGATIFATALAILPIQARAAQFLITGSGTVGGGPWVGQNISGPNGALLASLAGMTGDDTYSFSLVVDSLEPKVGTTQYYNTSAVNFSINGQTLLSPQTAAFANVHITDDVVDFFVLEISDNGVNLFPSLPGTEYADFLIQYALPQNTFSSTEISPDPSFLSGFSPSTSRFDISSNGSGVEDLFGVNSLAITPLGVPEPSTWLLMIAGVGLIGARLRSARLAQGVVG